MPQNAGLPSRASLPSIDGAHALPRLLDRAVVGRALARLARDRARPADGGSTARAARPSRAGPASNRVGIDDPRLRQRQRAGLVEHDRVDLGQTLDRVAGVEDDAGAEQRAGRHHLHRRDRQRQRARAGDDEHGDRRDDRIVHATRRRRASRPRSAPRSCAPSARRGAPRDRPAADSATAPRPPCSSSRSTSSISVPVAGGGHPHGQRAGIVQAAGIDRRAGGDRAARGLAGDQALVDLRTCRRSRCRRPARARPAAPAGGRRAAAPRPAPSRPRRRRSKRCATSAFSAARLPATARVLRRMAWSR